MLPGMEADLGLVRSGQRDTAVPEVSREQTQALLVGGAQLVEALGASYFADAHLPGAVNIPHDLIAALAPDLLPDKRRTLIVYCSDGACRNSLAAARQLRDLGYADVRRYRGGKQDWIAAGLPVERST